MPFRLDHLSSLFKRDRKKSVESLPNSSDIVPGDFAIVLCNRGQSFKLLTEFHIALRQMVSASMDISSRQCDRAPLKSLPFLCVIRLSALQSHSMRTRWLVNQDYVYLSKFTVETFT